MSRTAVLFLAAGRWRVITSRVFRCDTFLKDCILGDCLP